MRGVVVIAKVDYKKLKQEIINSYNLFDDDFASVVFEDKGAVEDVLRVFLDVGDLIVNESQTQYRVSQITGNKEAVFDVFASDSEDNLYAVEIQSIMNVQTGFTRKN